jgi:hypothetical protein
MLNTRNSRLALAIAAVPVMFATRSPLLAQDPRFAAWDSIRAMGLDSVAGITTVYFRPADRELHGMLDGTGTLFHRGTHNGYRAYTCARPANGWAMAVVMTGAGANADRFDPEPFRSVENVYGFPNGTLVR